MSTSFRTPQRVANYTIGSHKGDGHKLVAERQEWQGSNFRGGPRWTGDKGRLPRDQWVSFYASDYAIWSYATPIAWYIDGEGWVLSPTRYSISTTRHQSNVRMAFHWAGITPATILDEVS